MEKIKLIYVSSTNIGHVLEGQAYKLLEYYQTCDVFSEIVLLQPYDNQETLEKAKKVLQYYTFRTVFFYAHTVAPHKYFKTLKSFKKVIPSEVTHNSVIHTRGNLDTVLVRKALPLEYKDTYILTEFRGLTIDEFKVIHGHRWIDYIWLYCVKLPYTRLLLKKLYKDKNIHITAVSPYFKQVICKEGVPETSICVHPNIVSTDFVYNEDYRREIRTQYGISEETPVAVMSSGVGDAWQHDHLVLDRLLELGFTVFNLGKNKIEKAGVLNGFLPRSEMPKYLSAADVAVLWREDIPLNRVACPSKFGEFVTMGLYVIHNGTVAIAKEFIENNGAGIIVNSPESIEIDKAKLQKEERLKRCKAGYNTFSVECIASSYISHYQNKN